MAADHIVETQDLSIDFNGFYAVKGVSLKIARGSIHALIGPNGAGKTTCFNLITRFLKPTAGKILFNGRDITRTKPADIAGMGMVRSFQISATFPHLTVLENVRIALQRKLGTSFHFWRSENSLHSLDDRAMQLLEEVGLAEYAGLTAVELSYGRKRALEMAMTGDAIDAATAADWGLINRAVPPHQLEAATLDLISRATRGSTESKAMGKQGYYRQMELSQPQAYALASEIMAAGALTADGQEGIAAFLEKRPANYR
jgi:ABC-type lipoprotein export system ATPase subunit